jgi:hypothetical protein
MDTENIEKLNAYALEEEVETFFAEIHKDITPVLREWKKSGNNYERMYFCIPPDEKSYNGLANLYEPEFFKAVETLAANIYLILFADDPFFLVLGNEPGDDGQAKIQQALLEYQFKHSELYSRMMAALRHLCIYENIIIRVFWNLKMKEVWEQDKEGAIWTKNTILSDNPDFEIVNQEDFFIDPSSPSVEAAKWCFYRKKMSKSEIIKMKKDGLLDDTDFLETVSDKTEGETENEQIKEESFKSLGFDIKNYHKKDFDVYEYWGEIPKKWIIKTASQEGAKEDNDTMIEGKFIIVNGKLAKRPIENPYFHQAKPFIVCPLIPVTNKVIGTGISRVLEKPQYEINDTHNQILDHKTFSIFGLWLKNRAAGIKKKDMKIIPRNVIDCDDINGVREIYPNPVAFNNAVETVNMLKENFRQTSSANTTIQGIPVGGRRTAAEISTLYGESSTRIKFLALNIGENLLKPLLKMYYQLNQQYLDRAQTIRIVGDNGAIAYQTIQPDQVAGDFDFVPKVVTDAGNRMQMRQSFTDFLAMLGQVNAGNIIPPQAIYNLIRKIYDLYGFKDGFKMFPDWEVIKGQQMQEQAVQQTINDGSQPPSSPAVPAVQGGEPQV